MTRGLSLVILASARQVPQRRQSVQRPVTKVFQVQDRVLGEHVTEPVPLPVVGYVPVQGDHVMDREPVLGGDVQHSVLSPVGGGLPGFGSNLTGDFPVSQGAAGGMLDGRPQRADARRNYERVLAAAKEVLGELGVTAPLDEIARRAGVGNATMYRHFPSRRELVIAVYADEVTALCELGQSLLTGSPPAD